MGEVNVMLLWICCTIIVHYNKSATDRSNGVMAIVSVTIVAVYGASVAFKRLTS